MGELLKLRNDHGHVQLLLPWYVNGTLEAGESAFVEAHVAECAECRIDLASEYVLHTVYAEAAIADELVRPARMRALDGSASRRTGPRLVAGLRGWMKFAMAAAAAVVLIAIFPRDDGGDYRLLGESEAGQARGNAIVLFQPETPERDLRTALDQTGTRLVDGPTASGAYIVQVPPENRLQALQRLRDLPQVLLAEPVDAPES